MIYLCIILSVIIVAVCAVLALDAVPCVLRWYERIGIGSLSREKARDEVKKVTLGWLHKMPSVPLKDETRLTVIDRIKGEYKSSRLQSWQKGALLLGAYESGEKDAVCDFIKSEMTTGGDFKNYVDSPDFALFAYAVLLCSEDKQLVRPGMDKVFEFLKNSAGDGTVPYNGRIGNIRFVDTLGMVCPFLYLYGKTYGVAEAVALAERQLFEYTEKAFDEKVKLPFHCFNVKTDAPLGICGWGRGCGWYALALSEMLRCGADEKTVRTAEEFMQAILPYRLESGAFSRQILAESVGETTATAMIGHLASVLFKVTGKDVYSACARDAVSFLYSCIRKNGKTDYAQGDTKSIGFYSSRLDIMPAAQGFTLLLIEEESR